MLSFLNLTETTIRNTVGLSVPPEQPSLFSGIPVAPPPQVFHLNDMYKVHPSTRKVNLSIGAYRTEEGKPWVLPVVREAERLLSSDGSLDHEYLPILGYEPFCRAASALVLGEDNPAIKQGRVTGIQCISGTGSLRAGAEFLASVVGMTSVYFSKPTWQNHHDIFKHAGFKVQKEYTYWDATTKTINMEQLLADLRDAQPRSVVVLHSCAHNPTGLDPTRDEWKKIAEVFQTRQLLAFFDSAYQGFATGEVDADAWAVRYFVEQGIELVIAQSFSKNFGLYNERAGNLTVVVKDPSVIPAIRSQVAKIIRPNWSNPPSHGARIVHLILTTPAMREEWQEALKIMSSRIREMRLALHAHFKSLETPGDWDHVTRQIGMFSLTGLTRSQCDRLMSVHKVFLMGDGRISLCGLNKKNVEYVAKAIDSVVRNAPPSVL